MNEQPVLVGRSSSHFTRVARIFAVELGVEHEFRIVRDLTSGDAHDYAGNPALKIPVLVDAEGPLFGAENICRALAQRSERRAGAVLRGEIAARAVANAEELTLNVMSAEVSLIMAKLTGASAPPKVEHGIENSLDWLDGNLARVRAALPPSRSVSFVEVALFCLVRHLPFREIMAVERWRTLCVFADELGARPSARATEFGFDPPATASRASP
jgi:glutathione S-transferase